MQKIFLVLATICFIGCGTSSTTDPHNHASEEAHTHAEGEDHAHEEGDDHSHTEGETHDHSAGKTTEDHSHEGGITLSVEQAEKLGLTYEKIEPSDFSAAVRVSGIIEPSTNDNSTIVANVSGILKINQTGLNIGSSISKGAKLFTIESGELADNNVGNRVSIAKTALEKAQVNYDRVLSLSKDQMATSSQVEEAKLELKTAQKNYESLSKSQVISSPMSGYITGLNVKNGDFVNQGQALASVSSGKSLVVKADLPSRYSNLLASVSSANFITPSDKTTYSLKELNGRLLSKGNSISQNSYTIPVLFSVENRSNLISGTTLEVFLITNKETDVISVPTGALTEEQGAFYVYLKTCVDTYAKQLVKIGKSNGDRVEILDGLHSGDVVVTSGAYFVRLASASNAIPHGHAH